MNSRNRLLETLGILMIGDGVLEVSAPCWQLLL
jgi:hypothetical protein